MINLSICPLSTLVASSLISTLVARIFHVGSCSCSLNLLNAIPLHIHAIIVIQIVCSFPHLVTRILHLHVHQVQFHHHSFPCVYVQVQVHLHSDKDNIFKSIPETSSSCDQCDSNLPIISTIVAFINSYVHKVPLSSVSSNGGEMEHSHPSEYPAAIKFCPTS